MAIRVTPKEVVLVSLSPTEVEVEREVLPRESIAEVEGEQRVRRTHIMTVVCVDLSIIVVILEFVVTRLCVRHNHCSVRALVVVNLILTLEHTKELVVVASSDRAANLQTDV